MVIKRLNGVAICSLTSIIDRCISSWVIMPVASMGGS